LESDNPKQVAGQIRSAINELPSRMTVPVRLVRRRFSKRLAAAPAKFVINVALELLSMPDINRFVAYELIQHHRAAAASLTLKDLERLGRGLSEWGEVDCYGCFLSGPAWRERLVPDTAIHSWARSKNRWWRRAALVSTVPLNSRAQGGKGDTKRTLAVCRLLLGDRDDMVVKAMSWALRVLSTRDPEAVTGFLRANQKALAPRVLREVGNKLTFGLKNPRKGVLLRQER